MEHRDRDQVPGWDGEASGWNTYVRKVRLYWERTAPKKRRQIGAELASRLTGRAWDVSADLDHGRLQEREGATYLLEYLELRLGRSPIPDLGTRLEDFLVRLRRQPGTRMIQWTTELRECYRRLQRALARARGVPKKPKATSPKRIGEPSPKSSGQGSSLPIERRRSDTTAEPEPPGDDEVHPGDREDEPPPVASERNEQGSGQWTAAEWEAWWNNYDSPRRRRFGGAWRRDESDEEEGPQPEWERFQLEEIDALPPEVLGWIATNNKLDLDLIEKALRDQEEDLLQAEERRGPKRTYWVEQEGSWGLLLLDEPLGDETHGNIHWVGDRLPEEVHPVFSAKEEGNTWCTTHGDSEVYWTYLDGEWWTEDPEGAWWNWSDAKPWFDVNEAMAVDPAAGKEMQEALTLFQDKVRTFKESRQLVAARNTARGFYPLGGKSKGKGKGKGKSSFSPKGKGKAKKGGSTTASSPSSALAAEGSQRPGSSTYTGCFICGAKDHDFRRCPKRGSGKGSGAAHLLTDGHWTEAAGAYMVQAAPDETSHEPEDAVEQPELTEEPLCFMHVIAGNPSDDAAFGNFQIEAAMAVQGQLHPGFAVIDSGATETVGSLEAIEAVVSMRRTRYGLEDVRVFPEAKKSFRFGNAQQETATSYVEVPQTLGGRAVSLGVFALDVPRIPILLSIRTLKKLGAEINFQRKTIVFKAVDPGVVIGLQESASGHLLLDLVHDWLRTPSSSQGFSGTVLSQVLYHNLLYHNSLEHNKITTENMYHNLMYHNSLEHSQITTKNMYHNFLYHNNLKNPNFLNNKRAMNMSVRCLLCKCMTVHEGMWSVIQLSMCRVSRSLEIPWGHFGPTFLLDDTLFANMASKKQETSSDSSGQATAPKSAAKARPKAKSEKVKTEYDLSRATGPDPRDPRTAGPPCHGNHTPMAAGRGSLSGANAHGRWEVCKDCRLRLLYVPAFGAHAHFRQAGPLPADTKKALEIVEERVAAGEPAPKEILNAKAVALQGAEDSLLRRLETVRSQKAKAISKADGKDSGSGYPASGHDENPKPKDRKPRGAQPKTKPEPAQTLNSSGSESSGMDAVEDPKRIPKKATKRANAKDAELQEAQAKAYLHELQAGAIRESVKEILAGFDADAAELPKHRKGVHLLEIGTSGASGLRRAVEDRHGSAARMSPVEFDFVRKSGLENSLAAAESLMPALMWISVPCVSLEVPEDNLHEENSDQHQTQLYRRRRGRKVMKTALKLAEGQLSRGCHLAWEWPADSHAWKEPEMKGFLRQLAKRALLRTAIFEDKAANKRWRIVTTSPSLRKSVCYAQTETPEKRTPASTSRSLSVCSRYPPRLCRAVAEFALWAEEREAQAFGLSDEPLLESKLEPADRKRAEALVHRLHVRAGHPSGKTLAKVLKARGAHHEVIKIALEHTCPDCQEMRLPDLTPSVSLQQSEVPWKVIQIDNAEIRVDDTVTHFMVITDEATHFTVVAKLFERNFQDGRNATAEEAILALEQHWTQAYGFPDRLRCDPEGCFRSKLLEAWAGDVGIEVTPCPAEAHHQIGQVESLVKKLKQDAVTLLAGHPVGAHRALLHSAAARNTVHRVQGFSPAQWAFGRDFGPGGRLFESDQDLPAVQNSLLEGHTFRDHMEVRQAAEDIARRSQASYQLGRLLNMKTRRKVQFVPGDLVYYRRVQPPADLPAHPGLGFAKVGLGRWFGPARVLATETRNDAQGASRRPAQTVWIIASGRLKRCSPDQLRHASEREAARIVIVGYQDPDLATLVSSSPTMSRRTRQLVYQQATLRNWKTLKADVRAAFLQTAPTQISRCVFARPVPELARAMQLRDGESVQIAKACYGLVNAPAEWYRDVNRTLVSLGMTQLKSEPCAWRFVKWSGGKPRLIGRIAAHVDDFVICGDECDAEWTQIVNRFHQSYRWSPWEVVNYNHCGVVIKEGHREVIMDQSKYCSQIDEIQFSPRGDDELATKDEVSQLRAALGALQWRAYSTAYHGRFLHMKVTDLDGVSPEEVLFVAWADAAVGNRPDLGSTGGYIICASTPAMVRGEAARSSLAAETQAASEAEEELMLIRIQWKEMLGYDIDLRKPGPEISTVPGILVTDAKSLFDVLHKEDLNSSAGGLQEKYSALELLSLCERIREGKTAIRWVNSDAQVADSLTKPTRPGSLHQLLQSGRWRLTYDPDFTSAKRLKQRFSVRENMELCKTCLADNRTLQEMVRLNCRPSRIWSGSCRKKSTARGLELCLLVGEDGRKSGVSFYDVAYSSPEGVLPLPPLPPPKEDKESKKAKLRKSPPKAKASPAVLPRLEAKDATSKPSRQDAEDGQEKEVQKADRAARKAMKQERHRAPDQEPGKRQTSSNQEKTGKATSAAATRLTPVLGHERPDRKQSAPEVPGEGAGRGSNAASRKTSAPAPALEEKLKRARAKAKAKARGTDAAATKEKESHPPAAAIQENDSISPATQETGSDPPAAQVPSTTGDEPGQEKESESGPPAAQETESDPPAAQ
ncbi:RE2, partial [Symbiodinium microadriaticum]